MCHSDFMLSVREHSQRVRATPLSQQRSLLVSRMINTAQDRQHVISGLYSAYVAA